MKTLAKRSVLVLTLCLLAALSATPSHALVFNTPWIPDTLIVPPFPTNTPHGPGFIHLTRRIVAHQDLPGEFLLGHALYGLFADVPGYGWIPLEPECAGLVTATVIPGTVPGCGVEGIAFDESRFFSSSLFAYISTYNIDLTSPGGQIKPGGLWKAELARTRYGSIGSGGIVWTQLLSGIRGNGLAVQANASGSTTIVAGRIQQSSSSVGTDINAACPSGCDPSVYVSNNDGATWSAKTFTGSACSGAVGTSSHLVGGLAADPQFAGVFYAAANSGLWASFDGGATWKYELYSCGNSPGFAMTTIANPGRMYVGQNTYNQSTSNLLAAARDAGGPTPWNQLMDDATGLPLRLDGWVQSILLDSRDTSERTMFVATWKDPSTSGGGAGSVYKIVDLGNNRARVTNVQDSLFLTLPILSPYPLAFSSWSPSLFLAQNPVDPDLIYASSVYGGVWVRLD